ncbi:MAG: hypothetical protein VKK03_02055 [Synechococcus sp.]|nr:hypothetical protein [Synechococcus sp.]
MTESKSRSLPQRGGRLVVIDGRAYRRIDVVGASPRCWRLEALDLPQAIDWLIVEQQEHCA